MSLDRRQFLLGAAGLGTVVAVGGLSRLDLGVRPQTGVLLRSTRPRPEPFTLPLPIPAIARPTSTDGDVDRYEVTQRRADVEILPGTTTEIWGYDGTFPGPTFATRSGRPAHVTVRNELAVATVTHLHGGFTPAASDGYPTDLILPADVSEVGHRMRGDTTVGERTYEYPLDQRAATLWYHDHAMDFTGPNVYRGLAGFFLIGDDEDDALPLPRDDRDLPLLLSDRAFDDDAQFRYPALSPEQVYPGVSEPYVAGVLGDTILVNGAPWPRADVDRARYRLRVLNGSNARRYELVLDPPPPDGAAFVQIGTDGGLLARPIERGTVTLAPAERADLLVDFGAYPVGTQVELRNRLGSGDTARVMRFDVVRDATDDTSVPAVLSDVADLDPRSATATRTFSFRLERNDRDDEPAVTHHPDQAGAGKHRWVINGEPFSPDTTLAEVPAGATEVWRFSTDVHHPIHVHLGHFQVLDRSGRGLRDGDEGWKDTIDLIPGETAEVVVRFGEHKGRYVLHCHNLEHEDMAMMANYDIV